MRGTLPLGKSLEKGICGKLARPWPSGQGELTGNPTRDVIQLFAEGCPIKQIAGHLNLSAKTVEFHKRHVMVSFNLKSNAELVLFALKLSLIAIPSETAPFHPRAC